MGIAHRRSWILVFGAYCVLAPLAADAATELEVQKRLAEDCTALLDQLLGPGRAKVVISVQGEQAELRTQTEILTPTHPEDDTPKDRFPGFRELSPALQRTRELLQRDQESSTRIRSFVIKKIHAMVIIDQRVPATQVAAVQRILADMLRIDNERGDELTIAPFPIIPPWKSAFLTPEGIRLIGAFAGGAILITLAFIFVYTMVIRPGGRALEAISLRRDAAQPSFQPLPSPFFGAPGAEAERPPALEGAVDATSGEPKLLIGQRFNFLEDRKPEEVADLLRAEPPEDLALLFGSLAEMNPQLASLVFARLPTESQVQVTRELMDLRLADPERLAMLEQRLRTQIDFMVRGPDRISSIVSRMAPDARARLMDNLSRSDAAISEELGRRLITFEDLLGLPQPMLRRLLSEITYPDWAIALQGLPQALADRILELFPAETRELVAEELTASKPEEQVLDRRSKILSQALALAQQGQINLANLKRRTETVM